MLIPRYSLQTTLKGLTACAFFFLIMGYAYRGAPWAIVITVAVLSILATMLVHALFYALAVAFSRIVGAHISPAKTSQGGIQFSVDDQAPPELEETS